MSIGRPSKWRLALLDRMLDTTRCIQIGIRGSSEYLWEFSKDACLTAVHAEEVQRLGIDEIVRMARAVVGEALAILHGLNGLNIVGGDVVEVTPQYDASTNTAQAGAQMLFEILSLMAFSPAVKR